MEENKEREKEPGNANICGLSESVEMELELEGSAPEGVAPGEVELLAAMSEGMAAPTLLGLRVQRVLALVILLPHFCNTIFGIASSLDLFKTFFQGCGSELKNADPDPEPDPDPGPGPAEPNLKKKKKS